MGSEEKTYKQKLRIAVIFILRILIFVLIGMFILLMIADSSVNAFRWGKIKTGKIYSKSYSSTSDAKGSRTTRTVSIEVGDNLAELNVNKSFYDKYQPSDEVLIAEYKGKYWVKDNFLLQFLGSYWVLLIVVFLYLVLSYWKKITQKWLVFTEKEQARLSSRALQANSKLSIWLFWIGLLSFISLFSLIITVMWGRNVIGPNPLIRTLFYTKLGILGFLCGCGLPVIIVSIIAWIKKRTQWNYWDKKNVIIGSVLGFIAFLGLLTLFYIGYKARQSSLIISCANHRSFLHYELNDNIPENKDFNLYKLPYDPKLPGYAVFAKYTNHGTFGPVTNCNHGAPDNWFGGWQALNLPQEKLLQLVKVWDEENTKFPDEERTDDGVPYVWCGKPTGSKYRLSLHLSKSEDDDGKVYWYLWKGSVRKEDIDFLNRCLKKIGEKPVPIDVPDNVDWKKYIGKPISRDLKQEKNK